MNDVNCKKKGVSASPPGNDKCYLLQKVILGGGEGIISGLCKAAGKRESLSPGISHTAPQQLRSPLGQTCLELFISQPSGSAKFSNQKSIWFVPLKLHFLIKKKKNQQKTQQKKPADLAVFFILPLYLSGTEDSLKHVKMNEASGLCFPVFSCPGLADAPGALRGSVWRYQDWNICTITAKGQRRRNVENVSCSRQAANYHPPSWGTVSERLLLLGANPRSHTGALWA